MKKRVIAALAAIGLVAAMSGFGTLSASAEEAEGDTAVVQDTTTPGETPATPDKTDEDAAGQQDDVNKEDVSQDDVNDDATNEEDVDKDDATNEEDVNKDEDANKEDDVKDDSTGSDDSTADAPEEAAVPVVEGYTEEQVKEALAFLAANGVAVPDPGARTMSFGHSDITICKWKWWGWEAKDVSLIEYAVYWFFGDYDILPPVPYLSFLFPGNLGWDFGGLTGQQIYDNDCSKKVWVYHAPEAGDNEECWDGEAQPGSIWVKYTWNLYGKGAWVITGPNGYYNAVPFEAGWVEIPVAAGAYSVEFVPDGGWHIKHGGPYWIEIDPAINCECTVNTVTETDSTNRLLVEEIIIPVTPCAEAEVSVTPPTCEAASTLILGEPYLAEWGDPEYTGSHYKVTAEADWGYRFAPGAGVLPNGLTKTFEGDLAPKLTNCGALPVTGSADPATPLWLAGLAMIAGIGALVVSTRRGEKVTAE